MSPSDRIASILNSKGRRLWSVPPEATVFDALHMMATAEIGALPVISHHGKLLGIFSERDYARKVILMGRSSKETPVSEVMTSPAITADPEDTVEQCMQVMTNDRIRHLPVVDEGRVIGMVSIRDIVSDIIADQDFTIEQLEHYISGQ